MLYVNYEYLSVLVGEPDMAYSLRIITSQHDAVTQKRINDQVQAAFEARGIQISSTQLGVEFIESQKAQTDILVYFMLVMASLIAVVGGLGLMGTMSINVLERTREIGVMRAIGASQWRYSIHCDRRRHGHRHSQLGDQHPRLDPDHECSVLWRGNGNPHRPHACGLRRERNHRLADLHHRAWLTGKRAACKTGIEVDGEGYAGVRVEI